MKIINYTSQSLRIHRFEAEPGQAWCIMGRNRSGIDAFFSLVSGELRSEAIHPPDNCGVFSFSNQQALFEEELKKDDTDFLDRMDPGTPAREFLETPEAHKELIRAFEMDRVMDKGFRQLSTGQSRKILLLSQITKGATCLLIQAPYEGLDTRACKELDRALAHCADQGILIIATLNNPEDLPDWASHLAIMDQGAMTLAGPRQSVLSQLKTRPDQSRADFIADVRELISDRPSPEQREELIRLEQGEAGYEGRLVFKDLDLKISTNDHTLVSGPNGCGKSTLLHMIMGDHPACYQNRLWLFGIRRGTGESIWELKQRMGIVSPDLHRNYRVPGSALDCVLSGLYDSIGLYTIPNDGERKKAMAWLERISLAQEAQTPFRNLSYADQRLTLIARSLIKLPDLLILDEPTQGLDQENRDAVLSFLEDVARENLSTILYVSHRQDEFRSFFTRNLEMARFTA